MPILIGFTDMEDSLDVTMGEVMEDGISSEMYDTLIGDVVLNEISSLESNESCGTNNQVVLDAVNFVYRPYPVVTNPMELRKKFIDFNTERNFAAPSLLVATHMSKLAETYVYKFDIKPKTAAANEGMYRFSSHVYFVKVVGITVYIERYVLESMFAIPKLVEAISTSSAPK